MKKILLFHIYPINDWKVLAQKLLAATIYDRVVVHVTMPINDTVSRKEIDFYLSGFQVDQIIFSPFSSNGEVQALKAFVKTECLDGYELMTYMHAKGVTKPSNPFISDWIDLMFYFVVERMDICEKAFRKGYYTYGVNKTRIRHDSPGFRGANFFYEGNFVSLNLRWISLKEAVENLLENDYYGVEGFWGKLCSYRLGYSPFDSGVNHYITSVSRNVYRSAAGRWRYRFILCFYKVRGYFQNQPTHASNPD